MHAVAFLLSLFAAQADWDVALERPRIEYKTDREFESALADTLSAAWSNVSLRHVLHRLAETQRVAILLDRRIDPGQDVLVANEGASLSEVLAAIATGAEAGVSVVGNTVYVGPPEAAAKLRTLVELRSDELRDDSFRAPGGRKMSLFALRNFAWSDLDPPQALVERISRERRLTIDDRDLVPHDLWAAATLPECSTIEALSLVLIQFDRTFEWTDGAAGVRIVPAPRAASIERTYEPRRMRAEAAAKQWQEALPGLDARAEGRRVIVRGTAEEHDAVDRLLRPRAERLSPKAAPAEAPLSNRRLTLRYRGRADALIATLRKNGIGVEFDAEQLAAAGVDLGGVIEMDVKEATVETFFDALCKQLGLDYAMDQSTVTLKPR